MKRAGDLRRFAWLLRTYLAPWWPAVAVLVLSSYVATALAATLPVLMAPILDLALGTDTRATAAPVTLGTLNLKNLGAAFFQWVGVESVEHAFHVIVLLAALYVAVGLLKSWLDFGNYLLAQWARVRAMAAMQLDVFRHLLGLSMGFFNRQRAGDLISRLQTDTQSATGGLETIVCTILTAPLLIAFYGFLLVRTSPTLVLAAVAAAGLHYGAARMIRGPVRRFATARLTALTDVTSRIHETLLGIRVVKSFSAERFEVGRLARAQRQSIAVTMRFGAYKHLEEPTRAAVAYIVEATILVFAAWELLAGRLAAPTFFLFLYAGRAVVQQLGLLSGAYTEMQAVLAASARVSELLDQAPGVEDGPDTIDGFHDRIALRDVSFAYGGERVLEHVDVEIKSGEVVALVGPSGVGKSTLVDLVLRFYDPQHGVVTIDGRDLRTLRQAPYRRLFGVVSQETLLFNATIAENIAYARDDVSMAEIERAGRVANAHDFVMEFPDGYDTIVGDRGIRLSGGQRQRIAIARAIAGNPPILILDEATSSLDSESERLVQQAIDRAIAGATSIVIAHRLATVLHADKIVVMHRGGIEAVGRHADLLATSETYNELHRLQFLEAESGPGARTRPGAMREMS